MADKAALDAKVRGEQSENKLGSRASISNILSKGHSGQADDIQLINEAKNEEIINSLENESFYDKVLNNGAYDKAKQAQEKEKKLREEEKAKEEAKKEEVRQLKAIDQALSRSEQR